MSTSRVRTGTTNTRRARERRASARAGVHDLSENGRQERTSAGRKVPRTLVDEGRALGEQRQCRGAGVSDEVETEGGTCVRVHPVEEGLGRGVGRRSAADRLE